MEEKKNTGVAKKSDTLPAIRETKLGEIHVNLKAAKNRDKLLGILSTAPLKGWIKQHPLVKKKLPDGTSVPAEYLPIERVEDLLRKIFQRYKIEVKEFKVIANAISVSVRVHYIDPVTGEWDFQDGLGAMDIQTQSGKAPMDFMYTNSSAVQKALPAAKSYAVKDALDVLGKLFGGSLNRADDIAFNGYYDNRVPITEEQMADAKAKASRMEINIETLKALFIVTDAQIKEIEDSLPKQD